MNVAETFSLHLAQPALSKLQRNLIVAGVFLIGLLLLIFLGVFLGKILAFAAVIGLLLLISKPILKLKRIGSILFETDHILLKNPEMNMERKIKIDEINHVFIKKGASQNIVSSWKQKTLMLEMKLQSQDMIIAQVEVENGDVVTADRISMYFNSFNIPNNRKI